ncbi:putative surface protein [Chionoecetes opilio]|uniref:Putative surface protein n=1 Tax=Chionoecetes opilio TaxID=41210 RepID=A0A8J4Y420_CHIOP|nr:putative surface protein [Chionoecetes opilio]
MGDRARSLTIDGVRLIKDLKVVELKAELERRGLSKSGSKKELVERLRSVSAGCRSVCCAAVALPSPLHSLLFTHNSLILRPKTHTRDYLTHQCCVRVVAGENVVRFGGCRGPAVAPLVAGDPAPNTGILVPALPPRAGFHVPCMEQMSPPSVDRLTSGERSGNSEAVVVTSTPVTAPQVTSTPVTAPQVTSTPVTAPQVTSTPVTAPQVTSTPVTAPQSVQFENTKSKATAAVNEEDVPNRWLQNEPNLDNNDYIREYFQSQKALYRQQIEVRRQYRETATATVPGTSDAVSGGTPATPQLPTPTPPPPRPQPAQVKEAKVSSKGNNNVEVNLEKSVLGVGLPTKANVVPISSYNITTSVTKTTSTIAKSSAAAVFPDTKKSITPKVAAFSAATKSPNPGHIAAPKAIEGFSTSASTSLATPPQTSHPDRGRQQVRKLKVEPPPPPPILDLPSTSNCSRPSRSSARASRVLSRVSLEDSEDDLSEEEDHHHHRPQPVRKPRKRAVRHTQASHEGSVNQPGHTSNETISPDLKDRVPCLKIKLPDTVPSVTDELPKKKDNSPCAKRESSYLTDTRGSVTKQAQSEKHYSEPVKEICVPEVSTSLRVPAASVICDDKSNRKLSLKVIPPVSPSRGKTLVKEREQKVPSEDSSVKALSAELQPCVSLERIQQSSDQTILKTTVKLEKLSKASIVKSQSECINSNVPSVEVHEQQGNEKVKALKTKGKLSSVTPQQQKHQVAKSIVIEPSAKVKSDKDSISVSETHANVLKESDTQSASESVLVKGEADPCLSDTVQHTIKKVQIAKKPDYISEVVKQQLNQCQREGNDSDLRSTVTASKPDNAPVAEVLGKKTYGEPRDLLKLIEVKDLGEIQKTLSSDSLTVEVIHVHKEEAIGKDCPEEASVKPREPSAPTAGAAVAKVPLTHGPVKAKIWEKLLDTAQKKGDPVKDFPKQESKDDSDQSERPESCQVKREISKEAEKESAQRPIGNLSCVSSENQERIHKKLVISKVSDFEPTSHSITRLLSTSNKDRERERGGIKEVKRLQLGEESGTEDLPKSHHLCDDNPPLTTFSGDRITESEVKPEEAHQRQDLSDSCDIKLSERETESETPKLSPIHVKTIVPTVDRVTPEQSCPVSSISDASKPQGSGDLNCLSVSPLQPSAKSSLHSVKDLLPKSKSALEGTKLQISAEEPNFPHKTDNILSEGSNTQILESKSTEKHLSSKSEAGSNIPDSSKQVSSPTSAYICEAKGKSQASLINADGLDAVGKGKFIESADSSKAGKFPSSKEVKPVSSVIQPVHKFKSIESLISDTCEIETNERRKEEQPLVIPRSAELETAQSIKLHVDVIDRSHTFTGKNLSTTDSATTTQSVTKLADIERVTSNSELSNAESKHADVKVSSISTFREGEKSLIGKETFDDICIGITSHKEFSTCILKPEDARAGVQYIEPSADKVTVEQEAPTLSRERELSLKPPQSPPSTVIQESSASPTPSSKSAQVVKAEPNVISDSVDKIVKLEDKPESCAKSKSSEYLAEVEDILESKSKAKSELNLKSKDLVSKSDSGDGPEGSTASEKTDLGSDPACRLKSGEAAEKVGLDSKTELEGLSVEERVNVEVNNSVSFEAEKETDSVLAVASTQLTTDTPDHKDILSAQKPTNDSTDTKLVAHEVGISSVLKEKALSPDISLPVLKEKTQSPVISLPKLQVVNTSSFDSSDQAVWSKEHKLEVKEDQLNSQPGEVPSTTNLLFGSKSSTSNFPYSSPSAGGGGSQEAATSKDCSKGEVNLATKVLTKAEVHISSSDSTVATTVIQKTEFNPVISESTTETSKTEGNSGSGTTTLKEQISKSLGGEVSFTSRLPKQESVPVTTTKTIAGSILKNEDVLSADIKKAVSYTGSGNIIKAVSAESSGASCPVNTGTSNIEATAAPVSKEEVDTKKSKEHLVIRNINTEINTAAISQSEVGSLDTNTSRAPKHEVCLLSTNVKLNSLVSEVHRIDTHITETETKTTQNSPRSEDTAKTGTVGTVTSQLTPKSEDTAKTATVTSQQTPKSEDTAKTATVTSQQTPKSEDTAKTATVTSQQTPKSEDTAKTGTVTSQQTLKSEDTTKTATVTSQQTPKSEDTAKTATVTSQQTPKSEDTAKTATVTSQQTPKSEDTAKTATVTSQQTPKSEDTAKTATVTSQQTPKSEDTAKTATVTSQQTPKSEDTAKTGTVTSQQTPKSEDTAKTGTVTSQQTPKSEDTAKTGTVTLQQTPKSEDTAKTGTVTLQQTPKSEDTAKTGTVTLQQTPKSEASLTGPVVTKVETIVASSLKKEFCPLSSEAVKEADTTITASSDVCPPDTVIIKTETNSIPTAKSKDPGTGTVIPNIETVIIQSSSESKVCPANTDIIKSETNITLIGSSEGEACPLSKDSVKETHTTEGALADIKDRTKTESNTVLSSVESVACPVRADTESEASSTQSSVADCLVDTDTTNTKGSTALSGPVSAVSADIKEIQINTTKHFPKSEGPVDTDVTKSPAKTVDSSPKSEVFPSSTRETEAKPNTSPSLACTVSTGYPKKPSTTHNSPESEPSPCDIDLTKVGTSITPRGPKTCSVCGVKADSDKAFHCKCEDTDIKSERSGHKTGVCIVSTEAIREADGTPSAPERKICDSVTEKSDLEKSTTSTSKSEVCSLNTDTTDTETSTRQSVSETEGVSLSTEVTKAEQDTAQTEGVSLSTEVTKAEQDTAQTEGVSLSTEVTKAEQDTAQTEGVSLSTEVTKAEQDTAQTEGVSLSTEVTKAEQDTAQTEGVSLSTEVTKAEQDTAQTEGVSLSTEVTKAEQDTAQTEGVSLSTEVTKAEQDTTQTEGVSLSTEVTKAEQDTAQTEGVSLRTEVTKAEQDTAQTEGVSLSTEVTKAEQDTAQTEGVSLSTEVTKAEQDTAQTEGVSLSTEVTKAEQDTAQTEGVSLSTEVTKAEQDTAQTEGVSLSTEVTKAEQDTTQTEGVSLSTEVTKAEQDTAQTEGVSLRTEVTKAEQDTAQTEGVSPSTEVTKAEQDITKSSLKTESCLIGTDTAKRKVSVTDTDTCKAEKAITESSFKGESHPISAVTTDIEVNLHVKATSTERLSNLSETLKQAREVTPLTSSNSEPRPAATAVDSHSRPGSKSSEITDTDTVAQNTVISEATLTTVNERSDQRVVLTKDKSNLSQSDRISDSTKVKVNSSTRQLYTETRQEKVAHQISTEASDWPEGLTVTKELSTKPKELSEEKGFGNYCSANTNKSLVRELTTSKLQPAQVDQKVSASNTLSQGSTEEKFSTNFKDEEIQDKPEERPVSIQQDTAAVRTGEKSTSREAASPSDSDLETSDSDSNSSLDSLLKVRLLCSHQHPWSSSKHLYDYLFIFYSFCT